MRIAFLLGSGTSRCAGMPDVAEISEQVRSGTGVFLGTEQLFHLDPANPNFELLRPRAEPVIRFMRTLDDVCRDYYDTFEPGRTVDYEELAFLAGQIQRAVDLSEENPALLPLIRDIADARFEGNLHVVGGLAQQGRDYIRDITRSMLDHQPSRTDHLAAITDACRNVEEVDLFTLNHDLVLEAALQDAGVVFSDGFEHQYGDLRIWSGSFSSPTRLFKLHGSIDWWGYRLPDNYWRGYITARVTNGDPNHAYGPNATLLDTPHDIRPVFLAGTFDKIFGYEGWIFPDQHHRFQAALRASNRLVVTGYGFRDQAINSRLIDWLGRSHDNRIVVAHGEPEQLPALARIAIKNHWGRWVTEGRIRIVPSWIADTTWADIAAELNDEATPAST
jgi:hypothetical protein